MKLRYFQQYIFCLVIVLITWNCGTKVQISMVTSTSASSGLPFDALNGKEWRAEAGAEYVKLHIYADEVVPVSKIEAISCGDKFKESVFVFINFDEVFRSSPANEQSAIVTYDPPASARSVTFNFQKNSNICLKAINLYDEKGKKYRIQTPEIISATVKASETGTPQASYGVMNLFDSRYEYAWASDKGAKDVTLDFKFEDEVDIQSIKIWNGYQRSDVHCVDNGRVTKFQLTGDDGYSESISLSDDLGSQTIPLKKKFSGKNLQMKVEDFVKGRNAKGIVISEIRFFDGKNWFLPNPFPNTKAVAESNVSQFKMAGLSSVLNRSLEGGDAVPSEEISVNISSNEDADPNSKDVSDEENTSSEESYTRSNSSWILRFRSDGSMFLEGTTGRTTNTDSGEAFVTQRFFALGNYEVKKATEKGMIVRIFGFLRNQKTSEDIIYGEGDCNGCGRDCNKLGSGADPNSIEKIFQEYLEISLENGAYIVKNQKKTQNLDFEQLELTLR
jgi:hypothetical protein